MGFLIFWMIMGCVVGMIASSKGRSFIGWALYGFVIWPIALVHILLVARDPQRDEARAIATGQYVKCPSCAELVRIDAKICKHCGRDIVPSPPARAEWPELGLKKLD